MRRLVRGLAALAAAAALQATPAAAADPPWIVYYGDSAPVAAFVPYRVVVLDADHYPQPLRAIAAQGSLLLGYMSLGEVENHRSHYQATVAAGIVLDENPNWPGSYYVDVRSPAWTRLIVDTLAPAILAKGFSGFFLDTLDNPPYLERTDPARFAGMTDGAANLVTALRQRFPQAPIMLNRAFEILPRVVADIDFSLGESVFAAYDFETKKYKPTPAEDRKYLIAQLQAARKARPELKVMTLDYWDPDDKPGIAKLYQSERALGFNPYVATIDLRRIVPEPRR
ncbi:MAG: endo alpha-1,4 polygalactosaminidase [Ferrovibrionaceae bacterium]